MGVVNVTPDSFSDGGAFLDADSAIAHARELVDQGADILDVGGESTRPGAEPVSAAEELRRVVPVLEGIAAADWFPAAEPLGGPAREPPGGPTRESPGGPTREPLGGAPEHAPVRAATGPRTRPRVSIDTAKASVARAAVAAGASIVNDVSAMRADPEMVELVAESDVDCCLMHMLGEPRTMQREPRYADVVDDVRAFLEERLGYAVRGGVAEERIMLDPGIGFGKTILHNLTLLARLGELTSLGRPLVVGTSRKSFIGRLLADAAGEAEPVPPAGRLPGTIATNVLALERGASVFRVHDVAAVRDALAVAAATLGGRWTARAATRRTT